MMNNVMKLIRRKASSQGGFSLVVVMGIFASAFVGFFALTSVGSNHLRWQTNENNSMKAFYLAEAAVEHAKDELRQDFDSDPTAGSGTVFSLGDGEYQFTVTATANPIQKLVTGTGAVPSIADPDFTHTIEAVVEYVPPATLPDIFDNVLWASGDLNINGNNRTVDGEVFAGGDINCNPGACNGVNDPDPEQENNPNYPFQYLDTDEFEALKEMAQSQGYYFTGTPSASDLPTSFYYQAPDPGDPSDKGIPNVIFIENDGLNPGNLVLNGSDSVGGLYIVVGDYMSNPAGGGTATMNGAADLDGVIYVVGEFVKNGGGNNTTVDGGIIAMDVTLNGKSQFTYNEDYADSIEQASIGSSSLSPVSWNQTG